MMSFNSGSIITSTRTEKSIVKTNVSFIRSRAIVVKVLYELSSLFGVCLPLFMSLYPMVPALPDLCHFHFVIFMLYRRRKNNNFALKKKMKWPQGDKTKYKEKYETTNTTLEFSNVVSFVISSRDLFQSIVKFNSVK